MARPWKYGQSSASRRAALEATEEAGTRATAPPRPPARPSAPAGAPTAVPTPLEKPATFRDRQRVKKAAVRSRSVTARTRKAEIDAAIGAKPITGR